MPHRRVLRCPLTYMTAAGTVSVERTLYSTRQDGERAVAAMDQLAKGPAGYHEASCATLCYYDREGKLLHTVRLGRMPESGKVTLKGNVRRNCVTGSVAVG